VINNAVYKRSRVVENWTLVLAVFDLLEGLIEKRCRMLGS
jgi:hypothetical protein